MRLGVSLFRVRAARREKKIDLFKLETCLSKCYERLKKIKGLNGMKI